MRTHIEVGGDDGATVIPVNRSEHDARAIAVSILRLHHDDAVAVLAATLAAMLRKEKAMRAALAQCEDYFDGRSDVVDGSYGVPAPNAEMQMLNEIRQALGKGD